MAKKRQRDKQRSTKLSTENKSETHCSGSMNLQDVFKSQLAIKTHNRKKITLDKRFKIHWKQIIMYIQQSISKADTFGTYIFMRNKHVFELHRFD